MPLHVRPQRAPSGLPAVRRAVQPELPHEALTGLLGSPHRAAAGRDLLLTALLLVRVVAGGGAPCEGLLPTTAGGLLGGGWLVGVAGVTITF